MSDDGRDQNEDSNRHDQSAFRNFIDGSQDMFICDSCGSEAYRTYPEDSPGALYAEVDGEPAIVCYDCDDTYDWETIESRIRFRRGVQQRSVIRRWFDHFKAVWGYPVHQVQTIFGRWRRTLPWPPTGSSNRRGALPTGKQDEHPNELQIEIPHHEEDPDSLDETEELRQTREWATYLESELHEREDQLQDLEARLAQVRQELEVAREDGPSEVPLTNERHDLLSDLFDIRDNFRRLLDAESVLEANASIDFIEGIELIDNQIQSILEREGVEVIDTSGEVDPTKHRVVSTVPTADADPGDILDVYRLGYRLDDRVLREAHVSVAEEPPADEGSGPTDNDGRVNRGGDTT